MASRGGHDGRRRAVPTAGTRPVARALIYLVAAVVAAAAWVFLVREAIDLGRDARANPDVMAWGLTVAATLGAAICALVLFGLLSRTRDAWAGRRRRARGRHR